MHRPASPIGCLPRSDFVLRSVGRRAGGLVLVLMAGWPVLIWYVRRISDHSDEPWGLLALIAALLFAPWKKLNSPLSQRRLIAICLGLGCYAVLFSWMPALIRAMLLMGLILFAVVDRSTPVAWSGLLLLSLPLIASAQFYAGYPLRLITTHLSATLISLTGHPTEASGTCLLWAGERIIVDAPCSGLHMLWVSLFIATLLACYRKLDTRSFMRLFQFTALVVFISNVIRSTALFFLETRIWPQWSGYHETVGLVLFGLTILLIIFRSEILEQQLHTAATFPCRPSASCSLPNRIYPLLFIFLVCCATFAPWIPHAKRSGESGHFPGWSAGPVSDSWAPLPLDERDAGFMQDFPGKTGVFTDGRRTWIVRWVPRATRMLHPAEDCLRGLGYKVEYQPIQQRRDGSLWSTLFAVRSDSQLIVHERIQDAHNNSWTDVSSWFWHQVFSPSATPCWMITELIPR